jgi:hypothetical protein
MLDVRHYVLASVYNRRHGVEEDRQALNAQLQRMGKRPSEENMHMWVPDTVELSAFHLKLLREDVPYTFVKYKTVNVSSPCCIIYKARLLLEYAGIHRNDVEYARMVLLMLVCRCEVTSCAFDPRS